MYSIDQGSKPRTGVYSEKHEIGTDANPVVSVIGCEGKLFPYLHEGQGRKQQ